jgi:DNA transposition AAA+ family ATPase
MKSPRKIRGLKHMRNRGFVETANYRAFLARWSELLRRGAAEACLMVVEGPPGVGKSQMLTHWATQQSAVFIRATSGMTRVALMRAVLEACCGAQSTAAAKAPTAYEALKREVLARLGECAQSFLAAGDELAVVVDEADHIAGKDTLEALRDLSDTLEMPIILVGMGDLQGRIKKIPHIASRVGQWARLSPAAPAEAAKDFKSLCRRPVDDDLALWVAAASRGLMREMMEAAAAVERAGARLPADTPVTLAAMAGQAIMPNRQAGGMVRVPGKPA